MVRKRKKGTHPIAPNHNGTRPVERGMLIERLEEYEARLIVKALKRHGGNVLATSQELGVNRGGLYKRMGRLGIDFENYRSWEWVS